MDFPEGTTFGPFTHRIKALSKTGEPIYVSDVKTMDFHGTKLLTGVVHLPSWPSPNYWHEDGRNRHNDGTAFGTDKWDLLPLEQPITNQLELTFTPKD